MAFRSSSCYMRMLLRNTYATSTAPKLKAAYASPTVSEVANSGKNITKKHGEFVPVYVALGLIALSVSFGVYTSKHHLMYSPAVYVRKSKRETLSELENPDRTLEEAEKFINRSFFRKVAHVQDFNAHPAISDHIRGDVLARPVRAETLKDVGVDTKLPNTYAQ